MLMTLVGLVMKSSLVTSVMEKAPPVEVSGKQPAPGLPYAPTSAGRQAIVRTVMAPLPYLDRPLPRRMNGAHALAYSAAIPSMSGGERPVIRLTCSGV